MTLGNESATQRRGFGILTSHSSRRPRSRSRSRPHLRGRVTALAAALTVVAAVTSGATLSAPPAAAESNGVGATPAMGWSSWSFIRHD
ncbi:MAG: hypothetical protein ACRDNF_11850, partial [Streptosporangiaceae bacterium]